MSSFSNPHYMYLFELRNGKQKLAYGQSPEDALDILSIRLTDEEMAEIIRRQVCEDQPAGAAAARSPAGLGMENMDESAMMVSVVYQGGVFIPEQDVSFLEEGARLDLAVPAPPDEWDELLEELVALAAASASSTMPDGLDWMAGRSLSSEEASRVIDVEQLLGWGYAPSRSGSLLL